MRLPPAAEGVILGRHMCTETAEVISRYTNPCFLIP